MERHVKGFVGRIAGPASAMFVIAVAAVAAPRVGVAQPAKAPPAAAGHADDAKAAFERACSTCHELGIVTGQRKTRQGWEETFDNMVSHGLAIDDAQADEVVEYLVKTYPAN